MNVAGEIVGKYAALGDRYIALLKAFMELRKACNYIRPFAGAVAMPSPDMHQALDAKRFMDAVDSADAVIAKALAETQRSSHANGSDEKDDPVAA